MIATFEGYVNEVQSEHPSSGRNSHPEHTQLGLFQPEIPASADSKARHIATGIDLGNAIHCTTIHVSVHVL
jgi:hypothetical protein